MVPINQGTLNGRGVTRQRDCLVNPVCLAISAMLPGDVPHVAEVFARVARQGQRDHQSARRARCRSNVRKGRSALVTPKRPCERARAEPI
jgi:hypothetical protein